MQEETKIELMKKVILNLGDWLNTPNEQLEDMIGISWMEFWDLHSSITGKTTYLTNELGEEE